MELNVTITDETEWKTLVEHVSSMGAAMVPHGGQQPLRPGLEVSLELAHAGQPLLTLKAEVIHVYEDQVAVGLQPAEKDKLCDFKFGAPKEAVEAEPKAMWKRYEQLSKVEKLKMARHGNADARRRVLKDRDSSLHMHVLNNPGLKPREISSMVRSGYVNPDFLKRIVGRKDLMANHEVVDSIINNPHTPVPVAVSLLPRLRLEAVRRIAKQGRLRDAIVKAARKRVITR